MTGEMDKTINEMRDANFSNKINLSKDDFSDTAKLISNSFSSI